MSEYAKRNVVQLDENGGHYWRHMLAMTRENLSSKSDIAAELAWRDCEIARMKNALEKFRRAAAAPCWEAKSMERTK